MDSTGVILSFEAKEVFDMCLFLMDDPNDDIGNTHKVFALMSMQVGNFIPCLFC